MSAETEQTALGAFGEPEPEPSTVDRLLASESPYARRAGEGMAERQEDTQA